MTVTDPEVHSLTGAYACDALEPGERAAFELHLAVCPTCAQEVAELRETVGLLAVAVAEPPPARLKTAVDARIGVTRQLAPVVAPHAVRAERSRNRGRDGSRDRIRGRGRGGGSGGRWDFSTRLGWGLATAMAVVVAVLGIRVADQQTTIDQAHRQTTAISALLTAPDVQTATAAVSTGGTAAVAVSRSRDEAAISLVGLTTAGPGKTYQLWMIGPDGIRSGGVLPASARSTGGPLIAHGLGSARTVGLTVEPAGGSAQPTSTPVLLLAMPA